MINYNEFIILEQIQHETDEIIYDVYEPINEEVEISLIFLTAMILSLPKIISLVGLASKKIRNLFITDDKKWDITKLEKMGEKLHHIYIMGISKIIKISSKVLGKWELNNDQAIKISTYVYWAILLYLGLVGVTELVICAGKYGLAVDTVKLLTTLTKTYEISLVVVGIYLLVTSDYFKSLKDAVYGLERCIENPPKGIDSAKIKELIKKGGKRPSNKTYRKLVLCVIHSAS